jgi:hypothetical protein
VTRPTPATRALIGCLALASDDATLNQAAKLAGYELRRVVPAPTDWTDLEDIHRVRLVVRNGRTVFRSGSARTLTSWMLRLGRKLSALGYAVPRQARRAEAQVSS